MPPNIVQDVVLIERLLGFLDLTSSTRKRYQFQSVSPKRNKYSSTELIENDLKTS